MVISSASPGVRLDSSTLNSSRRNRQEFFTSSIRVELRTCCTRFISSTTACLCKEFCCWSLFDALRLAKRVPSASSAGVGSAPSSSPGDGVGHFSLLTQRHGRDLVLAPLFLFLLLISRPLLLVVHHNGLGLQHLANVRCQSRQFAALILQVGAGTSRSGVGVLLQMHLVVVAVGLPGSSGVSVLMSRIATAVVILASVIGDYLVLGAFARRLAMLMMMRLVLMLPIVLGLMMILITTAAAAMPCTRSHHDSNLIQFGSFPRAA